MRRLRLPPAIPETTREQIRDALARERIKVKLMQRSDNEAERIYAYKRIDEIDVALASHPAEIRRC